MAVSAGRRLGLLVGGVSLFPGAAVGMVLAFRHDWWVGRVPATSAFLAGESRDRSRSASPWLVTAAVPLPRLVRSSTSPISLPDWLAVRGGGVLSSGGEPPRQVFRCRVACGPAPVVVIVVAFASSVAQVFIVLVVAAIAVVVVAVADVVVVASRCRCCCRVRSLAVAAVVAVARGRCRCCCRRTRALPLLLLPSHAGAAAAVVVVARGRCRCCCCRTRALPLLLLLSHAGAAAAVVVARGRCRCCCCCTRALPLLVAVRARSRAGPRTALVSPGAC